MKLGGVVVRLLSDNIYYRIEGVYKQRENQRIPNNPEESLQLAKFELSNGKSVGWDDFEIHFPPDQGIKHRGKVIMGWRHMTRQYKLGPATDNFKLSSSEMRIDQFFNHLATQKYDNPSSILNFPYKEDLLFTENFWLKQLTPYQGELCYGPSTKIARLNRDTDRLVVSTPNSPWPDGLISKVFGNMLTKGSTPQPKIEIKLPERDYDFLCWRLKGKDSIIPDFSLIDVFVVPRGTRREAMGLDPNSVAVKFIVNASGNSKGFFLYLGDDMADVIGTDRFDISSRDAASYYIGALSPPPPRAREGAAKQQVHELAQVLSYLSKNFFSLTIAKRTSYLK
jgi:hypothetical protein